MSVAWLFVPLIGGGTAFRSGLGRRKRFRLVDDRGAPSSNATVSRSWYRRRGGTASGAIGMQSRMTCLTIRRRDLSIGRHHVAVRDGR